MKLHSKLAVAVAAVFGVSSPAWAHVTSDHTDAIGWSWPPYIIIPLVATAALYLTGLIKMRGRGTRLQVFPILCFAVGWTTLMLALDSPMHEISEQLFWVHMTQHEILMLVSAPLLVLSRPLVPFLWALPAAARDDVAAVSKAGLFKRAWVVVSAPAAAWLLHAAALWLWHAPVLFAATIGSDLIHALQHVSFLGTALLFWWALLDSHGGRLGYGGAIIYVFTTAIHTSVLGALLTFAPTVWYAPYLATAPAWHLTALEDQQIGGLVMWIPAGTLLTVVGVLLFVKWMKEAERRWEYTRTAALIRSAGGSRS
jgi:putative membrane protein